jgi:ABC-type lipoprotein export system ATPase subunit
VRHALDWMGIELLFTPWGAVLAQTLIATPIITRTSRAAFAAIDTRYEQAAQTLGLTPGQVFLRVALPMARPVLLSGVVLCWARAVGEFGATLMVAGATRFRTETLPIAVYLNISSGELGIALVCAWLLITTGFLVLLALRWIGAPLSNDQTMLRIGYLFQDLLLFPHLIVRKNLLLATAHLKLERRVALKKIETLLQRFGITKIADRYPDQISGGEKQRAALARAIAAEPRILLLDEPFSSLDAKNAQRLRTDLKKHQRHFKITTIFVTHNLDEARLLADRIGVIRSGRLYNYASFPDAVSMEKIADWGAEADFPATACIGKSNVTVR